MKMLIIVALAALLVSATAQAEHKLHYPYNPDIESNVTLTRRHIHPRAVDLQAEWAKAWCKGSKLSMAMIKPEAEASNFLTPIRSPWDGDMAAEFATWGYREVPNYRDELCDFGPDQHHIARAFQDLGMDTRSAGNGGPNHCHHVEHQYGPTVERGPNGQWPHPNDQWYTANGRRLRETQAFTTLGTNVPSGAIFFMNRLSPRSAASENWGVPLQNIQPAFLPDLSASSDHAWAFWSRAHPGGAGLADINKIFMCMITNDVTLSLIAEALRTYPLPPGMTEEQRPRGVEKWPGTTFEMHYDAAQVLLGSPNGLAAGYLLSQHKHRFGKSKTIEKVTVFRPDKGMMPYLLFWVIDAPAGPVGVGGKMEDIEKDVEVSGKKGLNATETKARDREPVLEERIVRRGGDKMGGFREHVFRIRL